MILDGNMLWSFIVDWIFEIAIVYLLSQYKTVPFFSPISSNILLSQIAWEVALDAETYSASAVDWATTLYFFENQEQMLDQNKKA